MFEKYSVIWYVAQKIKDTYKVYNVNKAYNNNETAILIDFDENVINKNEVEKLNKYNNRLAKFIKFKNKENEKGQNIF